MIRTLTLLVTGLCLFAGPALAEAPAPAAPTAANPFDHGMQAVLTPYLKIQDALARDTTDGVADAAKAIIEAAGELEPAKAPAPHTAHYAKVPPKIVAGAEAVRDAKDLKTAREAFKELSKPMGMWATMSEPAGVDLVYCSMAKGSWLQPTGAIRNPYHGSEMLACGEVVRGPGSAKK